MSAYTLAWHTVHSFVYRSLYCSRLLQISKRYPSSLLKASRYSLFKSSNFSASSISDNDSISLHSIRLHPLPSQKHHSASMDESLTKSLASSNSRSLRQKDTANNHPQFYHPRQRQWRRERHTNNTVFPKSILVPKTHTCHRHCFGTPRDSRQGCERGELACHHYFDAGSKAGFFGSVL